LEYDYDRGFFRGSIIPIEAYEKYGEFGSIVVNYEPKTIVPLCLVGSFLSTVHTITDVPYKQMVLGLFTTDSEPQKKITADSIITTFAYVNINNVGRVIPIITNKDELFYGSAGIILDSHKNILLMSAVEYDFKERKFQRAILYANPCVFNKENLVTKSILGKVLPFFVENKKTVFLRPGFPEFNASLPVEVVIKDMSEVIQYPKKPSININEELNDFLLANADDVVACASCQ
jgi:hypothetical protein